MSYIDVSILTNLVLGLSIVGSVVFSFWKKRNMLRLIFVIFLCLILHVYLINVFLPIPFGAISGRQREIAALKDGQPEERLLGETVVLPYNYVSAGEDTGLQGMLRDNTKNILYFLTAYAAGVLITYLMRPFCKAKNAGLLFLSLAGGTWLVIAFMNVVVYQAVWQYIDLNLLVFGSLGYSLGFLVSKLLIRLMPEVHAKVSGDCRGGKPFFLRKEKPAGMEAN